MKKKDVWVIKTERGHYVHIMNRYLFLGPTTTPSTTVSNISIQRDSRL